ncbi:MAG TPA: choice-of-anchor tandem repeat GloVer-containing protein [Candidatus Cybelea sp.]|nr:choice-of-anchor tandem repeat GloVer-containing protein [Candidatus Cybelea sp.]
MGFSSVSRETLRISLAAAFLAGCALQKEPTALPSVATTASRATQDLAKNAGSFRILHRFAGAPHDGAGPVAPMLDVNGTLYGTTVDGGLKGCGYGSGCGTIFSVSTSGVEKSIYVFAGKSDGWAPYAALIDVSGTLYGTTRYGGGSHCVEYFGCGTLYTVSTSGTESVFYDFGSYPNGTQPFAGLLDLNGTFYGTTAYGGSSNGGTVFSLRKSGVEKVLHSFTGGSDGTLPYGNLIAIKGIIYGTTWAGGAGCGGSGGCGTVFSITPNGAEKILYRFAGGSDGSFPNAGLTEMNGMMYGTTSPFICCSGNTGWGTVFRVTTTGKEKVLHEFGTGFDGSQPLAGVIAVKGTLYGTTDTGGSSTKCGKYPGGCGTVYSISTNGTEKVLHSFSGGAGGAYAFAGLTYADGKLFGSTAGGGSTGCGGGGCGTIFSLSP